MDFIPFHKCFPEIALEETNIFTIPENKDKLPEGDYFLIENYCLDKTCDCCKVMNKAKETHRDGPRIEYIVIPV